MPTTTSKKWDWLVEDEGDINSLWHEIGKEVEAATKIQEWITITSFMKKDVDGDIYLEIIFGYRPNTTSCPLKCVKCDAPCPKLPLMFNWLECLCTPHFLYALMEQFRGLKQNMGISSHTKHIQQQEAVKPNQQLQTTAEVKQEEKQQQQPQTNNQAEKQQQQPGQLVSLTKKATKGQEEDMYKQPTKIISRSDLSSFLSSIERLISQPVQPGRLIYCNITQDNMTVHVGVHFALRDDDVCEYCTECQKPCDYLLYYTARTDICSYMLSNLLCFNDFAKALKHDFITQQQQQQPKLKQDEQQIKQVHLQHQEEGKPKAKEQEKQQQQQTQPTQTVLSPATQDGRCQEGDKYKNPTKIITDKDLSTFVSYIEKVISQPMKCAGELVLCTINNQDKKMLVSTDISTMVGVGGCCCTCKVRCDYLLYYTGTQTYGVGATQKNYVLTRLLCFHDFKQELMAHFIKFQQERHKEEEEEANKKAVEQTIQQQHIRPIEEEKTAASAELITSKNDLDEFISHIENLISEKVEDEKAIFCNVLCVGEKTQLNVTASSSIKWLPDGWKNSPHRDTCGICHQCRKGCHYVLYYTAASDKHVSTRFCFTDFKLALTNDFDKIKASLQNPQTQQQQHIQSKEENKQENGNTKNAASAPREFLDYQQQTRIISMDDCLAFMSHVEQLISQAGKTLSCDVLCVIDDTKTKMHVRASPYSTWGLNNTCYQCKNSYACVVFYKSSVLCFSDFKNTFTNDFDRIKAYLVKDDEQKQPITLPIDTQTSSCPPSSYLEHSKEEAVQQQQQSKEDFSYVDFKQAWTDNFMKVIGRHQSTASSLPEKDSVKDQMKENNNNETQPTIILPTNMDQQPSSSSLQSAPEDPKITILTSLHSQAKELFTHPLMISKQQLHEYDIILQLIKQTQCEKGNNFILLDQLSSQVAAWLDEAGYLIMTADQYRPREEYLYVAFKIATSHVLNTLHEKVVVAWPLSSSAVTK